MADENGIEVQQQQTGEQQQQAAEVNQGQQQNQFSDNGSEEIESRLAAVGHLLSDKDRQELEALKTGSQKQQTPPAGEQKPAGEEKKPDPKQAEVKTDKPAEGEGEKKNVFGLKVNKKADDKGAAPIVIENADQILPIVQKEFGMEIKDIKELPKFFETTKVWRKQAQQFEDVNKKHTQVMSEIESLPIEFHEAFKALAEGKDYKAPFVQAVQKFDYKLPADKHDTKALLEHYMPAYVGKFTDEDYAAAEKPPALEVAISLAKDKYELERGKIDSQRAEKARSATKQQEAINASLEGSAADLQKAFPEMDSDAIKQVRSVFEGGQSKVLSYFFNNDSTVKPDAFRRLALAINGESVIQEMMEYASHVGETKANEEILSRGADGPDPRRNAGTQDIVSDEVKKKIADMEKLGNYSSKRTF